MFSLVRVTAVVLKCFPSRTLHLGVAAKPKTGHETIVNDQKNTIMVYFARFQHPVSEKISCTPCHLMSQCAHWVLLVLRLILLCECAPMSLLMFSLQACDWPSMMMWEPRQHRVHKLLFNDTNLNTQVVYSFANPSHLILNCILIRLNCERGKITEAGSRNHVEICANLKELLRCSQCLKPFTNSSIDMFLLSMCKTKLRKARILVQYNK